MKKLLLPALLLIGVEHINAQDVTVGLISKYTFDESNIEDAVLNNDGTAYNVSYSTTGYNNSPGKAIFFDGFDGSITATPSGAGIEDDIISFNQAFSISFWFNLNEYNMSQPMNLLSSRRTITGSEAGGIEFAIRRDPFNTLQVAGRTVSSGVLTQQYILETQPVATTTWYFVTLTLDEFGEYKLFLNGVEVDDITPVNAAQQNNFWAIGASSNQNEASREFRGLIDDIRFYTRGLTPTEVMQLYNYIPMTVSIDEAEANNELLIYPNPTNDVLNFTISERSEYTLLDVSGKTIMAGVINPGQTLDVSDLVKGMYVVEIRNGDQLDRFKVLKK